MSKPLEGIRQAFMAEVTERLGRAGDDLVALPDAAALDRLHQEFDSLRGASRAVNCRCLERCARRLAELSRRLRRLPSGERPDCRPLLRDGISLFGEAVEDYGQCEQCRSGTAVERYLKRLQGVLARFPEH